ncbi:MAG: fumarate reductase/succinate dehydrogenase flavoprotein subunit, partial [Deltaproteobacteria bacterium]|nr:fumarate reductase/succinate dehydrogenase flavoprotein subunit [Deltaproteobacteria bacterium]
SALMQGLSDGYFVIPYTIGGYLAGEKPAKVTAEHEAFGDVVSTVKARAHKLLSIQGRKSPRQFHKALGQIMWERCGMARNAAGLAKAVDDIRALRVEFWENVKVLGEGNAVNVSLEMAGRVADFLEFGEMMCIDAWHRNESCGGHFREEFQTEEGEARRDDDAFAYVAAWTYSGDGKVPGLAKESLAFENVKLSQRSYK